MLKSPESAEQFNAFRNLVLATPGLLDQFRAVPDLPSFVALVQTTAAQQGFEFSVEEIHAALRASQQAWIERWI